MSGVRVRQFTTLVEAIGKKKAATQIYDGAVVKTQWQIPVSAAVVWIGG